jgi:hypothetical protein
MVGDGGHDTEDLDAAVDGALDGLSIVETIQLPGDVSELEEVHTADMGEPGISTSPGGALGLGLDVKPSGGLEPGGGVRGVRGPSGNSGFMDAFYSEGTDAGPSMEVKSSKKADVPRRDTKEREPRGIAFNEEFYQQYGKGPKLALAYLKVKVAGQSDIEQFSMFLKKVVGELAATLTSAFKVTSRPLLDKVPGVGEVQLAMIEQPQGMAANSTNGAASGSRIKYLLDKLNDSDVQDCINDAWAQSAVWNDNPKGGFVYEVFVRAESIDTDSMIMKYRFVCGTRE